MDYRGQVLRGMSTSVKIALGEVELRSERLDTHEPSGRSFVDVELTFSSFSIRSSMLENVRGACSPSPSYSSSDDDPLLLWASNAGLGVSDAKELLGLPERARYMFKVF